MSIVREPVTPALVVVEVGHVRLDSERHEVFVRNEAVKLPLKEFGLLEALLTNAGRVLTQDTVIDRVWGPAYVGDADVHIKRLRAKVERPGIAGGDRHHPGVSGTSSSCPSEPPPPDVAVPPPRLPGPDADTRLLPKVL